MSWCCQFLSLQIPTAFCLHFSIKSSISIQPALSPSILFILLLLASDVNPNPGPFKRPNVTYTNIRSIHNNYPVIAKFISDNETDFFSMSETWIRPDTTSASLSEITQPGYNLYQQTWKVHHGGGLGFFVKDQFLNSKTFHLLIDLFDLIQKVNFPTHIHGHTIDLVLTRSNNDNISNVHTTDAFCDHFSISFTLNLSTPRSQNNATVTFRKYHKIDKEKMKTDLLASELINNPSKVLFTNNITLSCPPLLTNTHHLIRNTPRQSKFPGWVDKTVIATKRPSVRSNGFSAEVNLPSIDPDTCRKSTSTIESACRPNLNTFKQKFRIMTTTPNIMVSPCWCVTQTISQDASLDKSPSAFGWQICGVFHRYICSTFPASLNLQYITLDSPPPMFSTFCTVTEDQVTKIIINSSSKSCSLDPWLSGYSYHPQSFNNQCLSWTR